MSSKKALGLAASLTLFITKYSFSYFQPGSYGLLEDVVHLGSGIIMPKVVPFNIFVYRVEALARIYAMTKDMRSAEFVAIKLKLADFLIDLLWPGNSANVITDPSGRGAAPLSEFQQVRRTVAARESLYIVISAANDWECKNWLCL